MATTYLTRTSGTPTNALKWTFSTWVKIASIPNDTFLLDFYTDGNNRSQIGFQNSDKSIIVYEKVSGSTSQLFQTTRIFKDNSGWYNIVVSCDRTLATAADRTKVYINGVQETSFSTTPDYPAQNTNGIINTAVGTLIGKYSDGALYFDGSMSHVHFVDGTAYPASTFGSTDSTTGEWEINTSPTVTYGNNGFFILKNDNVINDQSGNANNFTLGGGTLTKTEDCPDNVFATNNPLDNYFYDSAFSNGNTTIVSSASTGKYSYGTTTFGIPDGKKIYCEVKMVAVSSGSIQARVGLISYPTTSATVGVGSTTYTYGYSTDSGNIVTGNAGSSYGTAFALGDIMGIAIDTVNNKLYFSKNGTWQNSGDPTSGATGTGAVSIADLGTQSAANSGNYFLGFSDEGNTAGATLSWNFGNGYFGTTAVSSAGTEASTPGIFEYDVPTNYQPLSTKGLNA